MDTILVFAGGDRPGEELLEELPDADLVVAADSGYDHAAQLGYRVDVVVGDMDSIKTSPLPRHVVVERHPPDKDASDLDLTLELVIREDPDRVVVIGGSGGRIDHELAATGLLCDQRWDAIEELDWLSPRGWAHVIRRHRAIHADEGSIFSLIPLGGDAIGVTTRGLKWNLHGETLTAGSTRGISNVMTSPVADIAVDEGCLLAVLPSQP